MPHTQKVLPGKPYTPPFGIFGKPGFGGFGGGGGAGGAGTTPDLPVLGTQPGVPKGIPEGSVPPNFSGQNFLDLLFGNTVTDNSGLQGFTGNPDFISRPLLGTLAGPLQGALGIGAPVGFATLLDILGSQGATDPKLLNRQLADIAQTTQGQQDSFQGQLARSGLTGSGIGQAIGAAIGQSGGEQRADLLAQEAAKQEQQKRQDLQLLFQLLGIPTDLFAIQQGVPPKGNTPSDFEKGLGVVGDILDSISPF
jgi:hypothetical protein